MNNRALIICRLKLFFVFYYACSRHAANDAAFAVSFICRYYSIFEPRNTRNTQNFLMKLGTKLLRLRTHRTSCITATDSICRRARMESQRVGRGRRPRRPATAIKLNRVVGRLRAAEDVRPYRWRASRVPNGGVKVVGGRHEPPPFPCAESCTACRADNVATRGLQCG